MSTDNKINTEDIKDDNDGIYDNYEQNKKDLSKDLTEEDKLILGNTNTSEPKKAYSGKKRGPKPKIKSTFDIHPRYKKLEKSNVKKRRGRLLLILDNLLEEENSHLLRALFSRFYPYYVKQHEGVLLGMYEYYGYSDDFDEITTSDNLPTYEVKVEKGSLIGFKRI